MPYKDKEKERERQRLKHIKYKEKDNERNRKYRENNIEKERERGRVNYNKNKENIRERHSKYNKTENGKKSLTISNWKYRGLVDDYEMVYEKYMMAIFCDICECVLDQDNMSVKCMDHCHNSGLFRNIVCKYCNFHICK